MKKLLLILLCLPMIGFGQILDTSYVVACDSYEISSGNIYVVTQSGVYYWDNCDGMGNFYEGYYNVTILNSTFYQQTILICYGDSVSVGNNVYDTTGNYTDIYTSVNGCDSIIYTNISIAPSLVWQWGAAICYGDSVMVGTSVYDTTGNYIDTLNTVNGCDSIVYTNISINNSPNTTSILGATNASYLQTETYSVGQNLNSTFLWCLNNGGIILNGINTNSVEVQWGNNSGIFELYVVETAQNGCSDTVFIDVNVVSSTSIQEHTTNKELLKVTDLLGRETPYRKNTPLFYIYDDGTVEKRIVIE